MARAAIDAAHFDNSSANNNNPSTNNSFYWTLSDDVSYTKGRHLLKVGILAEHLLTDKIASANIRGTYTFQSVQRFLAGSPVLAADDGVVAVAAQGATGYGNYVVVAHSNGLTTLYGHLAAELVKPGDPVVQGQPIGLEGSTGMSTGAHLHFEVRVNGQPMDPRPFLPAA